MFIGRLGAMALAAATLTKVYTVPTTVSANININVVNRTSTPAKVRIAISTTDVPVDADYIEYDALLDTIGDVVERTCIVCSPGERVFVYSDVAGVSVRISGIEENV